MSINERTNNITYNNFSFVDTKNLQVAGELIPQEMEILPHSTFSCEKQEIVTIIDGSSNQVVDIPSEMDETRFANDASDNSVASFLSRPLIIGNWDWTTGTAFNVEINPWKAFLENKRVVNRIATYKLFRGKMKVKVLINGNSFYFGRVMMSYWPLWSLDTMTQNINGTSDFIQFSQMPRIFLDPCTSQGGEMTLPFFWHNDYIDLLSNDKDALGKLVFNEMNVLKHCNGDQSIASTVSISLYVWLEDVELQGPTAARATYIVPQSTQPKIGPYAKGSELKGSSNVLNPSPSFFVPRGISNMNLTDVCDTTNKMTFTSSQEVSMDPRILGLSDRDEMNIKDIASRESFLVTSGWTLNEPVGDIVASFRVTPNLHNQFFVAAAGGVPAHTALLFPACCGAVLPFTFWNGTFKIRMQIVASAFHRGRLAVVYDPQGSVATREDNVQYTHIIDIATCRDVTFKVGPNQEKTMLRYLPPEPGNQTFDISTTPLSPAAYGNGTITVYVLNELTLPNVATGTPNIININYFVSIDDLDVFVPSDNYADYLIAPQSTGVSMSAQSEDLVEESDAYHEQALSLDQDLSVSNKRHLVYCGEKILSFKNMLNRYYPWAALRIPPTALSDNCKVFEFEHRIFPGYRGNFPDAVHVASGGVPTNYFKMTMLNYLAPAFSAWRGSIRYKLFPRCTALARGVASVSYNPSGRYLLSLYDIILAAPIASDSSVARAALFSGAYKQKSTGSIITSKSVNPCIEYEIPWWEPNRFCPGKIKNWTSQTGSTDEPISGAVVSIDATNSTNATFYDVHVAAGDDFSFYFFTGWPRMMYYPVPPNL
jgi:hypothetical protein